MDFGFTEEQEMLRKSFKDFFKKEAPLASARQVIFKRQDYSRELYRKMADVGFLSLMIPEAYGGMGGGWVDMTIFYEEAGRALLQSPHFNTVVLGAQLILAAGSEEQKKTLLPQITSGELVLAVAMKEKDADTDVKLIKTSAKAATDGYLINGNKIFVSNALKADKILCVAKVGRKMGLFLIDSKAEGINLIPMQSMAGEPLFEIDFKNVTVPTGTIIGAPVASSVISEIVDKAKILTCAAMVGMSQAALEMAIDYSKERFTFGKPIGAYQSLQNKMTRSAMGIDGARWLTYYAAWKLDKGMPAATDIAMAGVYAGQTSAFTHSECSQVHGAVGVFRDHNLTLYFTRVMADQLSLGHKSDMLETVAQSLGI